MRLEEAKNYKTRIGVGTNEKELEENHSEYVIEKPQELIEILEKINGGDNK